MRTLSCAHIYQADSELKVKLWVQKGDGKLQSRLAEKLKYNFLLSVTRLLSVKEKSFNCCFHLFLSKKKKCFHVVIFTSLLHFSWLTISFLLKFYFLVD